MTRNFPPFIGKEELWQFSYLFELRSAKNTLHNDVQKLEHNPSKLAHLRGLLVEAISYLVLDTKHVLLSLHCSIYIDIHVCMLHTENEVAEGDEESENSSNLVFG